MRQDTSAFCKSNDNFFHGQHCGKKKTSDISFRLKISGYRQSGFFILGGVYMVRLSRTGNGASCPHCRLTSHSLHGHYTRHLQASEVYGHPLQLLVDVRKFRCRNPRCPCRIFSEPLDGLACARARNTQEVERRIRLVSLQTTSRVASYMLLLQHIRTSPSSCLRRAHTIPQELLPSSNPVAIGIDDFAWKKGHTYGSIVVDQISRRPLAILPSREGKVLEDFLKQHPQLQYITRDRAYCFREPLTRLLPRVTQICDRFHLMKNMLDALGEELAARSRMDVRKKKYRYPTQEECRRKLMQSFMEMGDARHRKKLRLFMEADNSMRKGMGVWQTAKELGVHPNIISRMVRHHSARNYMSAEQKSILKNMDELALLISRGCVKLKELKERMRGRMKEREVERATLEIRKECERERRDIREYNRSIGGRKKKRHATKRKIQHFILTGKSTLKQLSHLMEDREAREIITLARRFRDMLNGMPGCRSLESWIRQAMECASSAMRDFANGIMEDKEAVQNAMDTCWSNGLLEGNVNKIKAIKRQMFNRAGTRLLNNKLIAFKTETCT